MFTLQLKPLEWMCEVYYIYIYFVCVFWLQGYESKLNILWISGPINCPPGVIFADASSFSDDLLGLLLFHVSSPPHSCGFYFIFLLFPQGDLSPGSSFVYTLNVHCSPADCNSAKRQNHCCPMNVKLWNEFILMSDSSFVCMCILWKPRQTLSLLFFFSVISMESGLQIMLSAWRCGRFSRMPQMDWWHLWVPQPASLWYVRTQPPFYCVVFVRFQYLMVFLRWVGVWGGEKWCSWPPGCRSPSSSSSSDWGSCWEGEWLTPFLPQVGLGASVIFKMSPSWDSYHSLWLLETQKSRITIAASQFSVTVTDLLVQCQTLQ